MGEAVLGFDELRSLSVDELAAAYARNGLEFPDMESLLLQIREDWISEKQRIVSEANFGEPDSLPHTEVTVDGRTYNLFGVSNARCTSELIEFERAQLEGLVDLEDNWAYDDAIRYHGPVRIYDPHSEILRELTPMITESTIRFMDIMRFMATNAMAYAYLDKVEAAADFSRMGLNGNGERYWKNISLPVEMLAAPADRDISFPPIVNIEAGPALTERQREAAYQAAFLSSWKPDQNTKNAIVKPWQMPEIRYFLQNGIEDQAITSRAESHARMAEEHPSLYEISRCIPTLKIFPILVPAVTASVVGATAPILTAPFREVRERLGDYVARTTVGRHELLQVEGPTPVAFQ